MSWSKTLVVLGLVLVVGNFIILKDARTSSEIMGAARGFKSGLIIWMVGVTIHIFNRKIHRQEPRKDDA